MPSPARAAVQEGLKSFILPLIAIRNRRKGYAVSIIKAGMKVVGRDSGPVRPPLLDLQAEEIDQVTALVAASAKSMKEFRSA